MQAIDMASLVDVPDIQPIELINPYQRYLCVEITLVVFTAENPRYILGPTPIPKPDLLCNYTEDTVCITPLCTLIIYIIVVYFCLV